MLPTWLVGIASGGMNLIGDWVKGWQERKTLKQQHKTRMAEIKMKRQETKERAEIEWDKQMARASETSWKDEFWTLILSIPMVMCFIPGLVKYVEDGFAALEKTPAWYKGAIGLAIAAAFGYRKYADWQMKKTRLENGEQPKSEDVGGGSGQD
jgi:hypothetical protein